MTQTHGDSTREAACHQTGPDHIATCRTIGILGVGEVGMSFAEHFRAYEINVHGFDEPADVSELKARTAHLDARIHDHLGLWLRDCDLLFSCVPASNSLEVGLAAAELIEGSQTIYVDLATAPPIDMRRLGDAMAKRQVGFVNVSIMGSIKVGADRVPLYLSGACSERVAHVLNHLGLTTTSLGVDAGAASAIKLLRSSFMKGLEALTIESLSAAQSLGLREDFLKCLHDLDQTPIADYLEILVLSHLKHAQRRSYEIESVAPLFSEARIHSAMLPATLSVFTRTVAARSRTDVPDNPSLADALCWLIEATPELDNADTHPNKP